MTKRRREFYRRRRAKIVHMSRKLRLPQVKIARKFKMTPQRVNQILRNAGVRPKDCW